MEKKRLFFDMDNVLVNFQSGLDKVDEDIKAQYRAKTPEEKDRLDEIPGLFSLMEPMEGAVEAVHELSKVYDVFILSTAPWNNPSAWSDKVEWVKKHFDSEDKDPNKNPFHKRMIISHRKDLCEGDYLIDDRGKNGTSEFKGEWIQFGSELYPDWNSVVRYLLPKNDIVSTVNTNKKKNLISCLIEWCKSQFATPQKISSCVAWLVIIAEILALLGIRGYTYIWGGWTIAGIIVISLLIFYLWKKGKSLGNDFKIKSVILTRLLANAIAPSTLGTSYLLLFVIHIGWLTNAAMSLYIDQNLVKVLLTICVCTLGMLTIIAFFPEGKPNKDGADLAVFISGVSMFAKNREKISFSVNGVNKEYTQILNKNTEMVVSTFDMCFKSENKKISTIKKENVKKLLILNTNAHYSKDFFKDTVVDVTNLCMTDEELHQLFGEDKGIIRSFAGKESVYLELNSSDVEDSVKTVIRITAIQRFPEEKEFFKNLFIELTKACDYDSFETCFDVLHEIIKKEDDNKQRLYFNLTPGTGIVGSLMTLFSLDKHRELYYYSQFTSHELLPVVKSKIPLENLLSQALETISDSK